MENIIKNIVKESINAPSGDNCQPWKFKINSDDNTLVIFKKGDGNNNYLDFKSRGTLIAHGALLKNIEIAASSHGYITKISLFPDHDNLDIVSKIFFIKDDSIIKDQLYDSLLNRKTNRKIFYNIPLKKSDKEYIIDNLPENSNIAIKIIEDKKIKESIFNSTTQMERIALGNKYIHKLFFDSIVWSKRQENNEKQGLFIKTMELPLVIQFFFKLLRHWKVAKILSKIGFPKKVAESNAKNYKSSSAVLIFSIKNKEEKESFIQTGQLMEEVWLRSTYLNVAVQPLAGLIYVYQRLLETGNNDEILSNNDIEIIKKSYGEIQKSANLESETISMILRIGYAEDPSAKSSKKEPEFL